MEINRLAPAVDRPAMRKDQQEDAGSEKSA
jgi:hypothetical protein